MITKPDILHEIRRITEANGGVPPGMGGFKSETGVRPSDWKGKYWVRWSDALREAGYTANQFSKSPDIAMLLAKYAELTQELGHLPVEAELLLKRRNDNSFPSHTAFRRFGTKLKLIECLVQHCRSHSLYSDIIGYCDDYLSKNQTDLAKDSRKREDEDGFVYLLKSGQFYKIGKTKAVGRREYELAIQLPEKAKRIHAIRTDDPAGIEAYWHKRFEIKRKNGEWFELNAADVAAFRRRKFM